MISTSYTFLQRLTASYTNVFHKNTTSFNVLHGQMFDAVAKHAHHGVLAYTKRNVSIASATPGPLQAFASLKLALLSCVVPAKILQRRISPCPHPQPHRNVLHEHLFDAMADHAHHAVLAYTKRKLSIAGATPGPL